MEKKDLAIDGEDTEAHKDYQSQILSPNIFRLLPRNILNAFAFYGRDGGNVEYIGFTCIISPIDSLFFFEMLNGNVHPFYLSS